MLAVVYSLSSGYAHNACLQPAPRLAATSRSAVMPIRVASVSMQIAGQVACEVRKLPKSSVALDITVPADISNKVHQAVLTELGKNANVPGFRKGKAPPEALLNHVGTHKVKKATVEEVIDLGMKQSAQQVQVREKATYSVVRCRMTLDMWARTITLSPNASLKPGTHYQVIVNRAASEGNLGLRHSKANKQNSCALMASVGGESGRR